MLAFLAARWINGGFATGESQATRLGIGLPALTFLMAAEMTLGVTLGLSDSSFTIPNS